MLHAVGLSLVSIVHTRLDRLKITYRMLDPCRAWPKRP